MSKTIVIASAAAAFVVACAFTISDAEARGFAGGGGFRAGNAGFRAPTASFRAPNLGRITNPGNRISSPGLGRIPGLKPTLPPGLKLPKIPTPVFPKKPNPGGPGGLLPHPGGSAGKGGIVAIGVAVGGTAVAYAECAYPYKKWQQTGSYYWKARYYSCAGY
jgi:hypothetical protein